jgi:anti-sigma B factor antagonist
MTTIEVRTTAAQRTVVVTGEIDLLTAPALHDQLFDVVAKSRRGDSVAIDLTAVRFFSAQGIRALLDAHQAAQLRRVELFLVVNGNWAVRQVLSAVSIERFVVCV